MNLAHKLVVSYLTAYVDYFKHKIELYPLFSNCVFNIEAHRVNEYGIRHLQQIEICF